MIQFNRQMMLPVALVVASVCPGRGQHVHVQVSYQTAAQWRLFIYDFDSGDFDPAEAPLFVAHQAFGFVPGNTLTNFLGPAGGTHWTLPETERADALFLGIGTSGIASGTFANNQIRLGLRGLSGPGHFALYNVDPFGSPVVHMNSRDGIDPASDSIALSAVGGHIHVNWAFSAPGTYRVGISASGRLAATGETTISPVVEYTFIVQDVPWRPRLSLARVEGETNFSLTLQSDPGRACRIESATDLAQWQAATNLVPTSPTTTLFVPAVAPHTRFRARVIPP